MLRVCVRAHGRTRKESKESRTHTHAVTPLPALDALDVTDFNAEGTDCSGVGEAHAFGLGSPHASHVLERRVLERGELFAHLRAVAASCQDDTRIICKASARPVCVPRQRVPNRHFRRLFVSGSWRRVQRLFIRPQTRRRRRQPRRGLVHEAQRPALRPRHTTHRVPRLAFWLALPSHCRDGLGYRQRLAAARAHLFAHARRVGFVLCRAQQLALLFPLYLLPARARRVSPTAVDCALATGARTEHRWSGGRSRARRRRRCAQQATCFSSAARAASSRFFAASLPWAKKTRSWLLKPPVCCSPGERVADREHAHALRTQAPGPHARTHARTRTAHPRARPTHDLVFRNRRLMPSPAGHLPTAPAPAGAEPTNKI